MPLTRIVPNGEKALLWKGLIGLLTLVVSASTAVAAWAIQDYLDFKERYSIEVQAHVRDDARLLERLRWQEATLQAICGKLDIRCPTPPSSSTDQGNQGRY